MATGTYIVQYPTQTLFRTAIGPVSPEKHVFEVGFALRGFYQRGKVVQTEVSRTERCSHPLPNFNKLLPPRSGSTVACKQPEKRVRC